MLQVKDKYILDIFARDIQYHGSIKNTLKSKDYAGAFNLNPLQLALLKAYTSKEEYIQTRFFVQKIKYLTIPIHPLRPIEEAISTVGGISINELNEDFSLKKHSNIYTIGEMIDWDAPTGGYLLQGCFSTAYYAAKKIIEKNAGK